MVCRYSFNSNDPFVTYLKTKIGNDTETILKLLSIANEDKLFRATHPNFDKLTSSKKYDILTKFYYNKYGDGEASVSEEYDPVGGKGFFDSTEERRYAINVVTGIMQRVYLDLMTKKEYAGKVKSRATFIELTKNTITKHAGNFLKEFLSDDSFTDKTSIFKALSDTSISSALRFSKALLLSNNPTHRFWGNLLKEINSVNEEGEATEIRFFEEVTNDPRLQVYNRDLSKDDLVSMTDKSVDGITAIDSEDAVSMDVDDVDLSTALWGDGDSGLYTNAMKHVNSVVRAYLGSLEKLKSPKKIEVEVEEKDSEGNIRKDKNGEVITSRKLVWDVDKDNLAGIPEFMDPNECVDVLYHRVDRSSPQEFIRSIKNIAEQYPGFESFAMFAEHMENDDQLLSLMFTTFDKQLITKSIVTYEDGGFVSRISNPNTDRTTALKNDFINSIKHTAINWSDFSFPAIYQESRKLYTSLVTNVNAYNKNNIALKGNLNIKERPKREKNKELYEKKIAEIERQLFINIPNLFKLFLPIINEKSVVGYISDTSNGRTRVGNIGYLIKSLENIITGVAESNSDYLRLSNDAASAFRKYKSLDTVDEETGVKRGKAQDIKEAFNAYKDILRQDYITPTLTMDIYDLAEHLINYTASSSELNSLNVHRNMSSDVINSSYLTYLKNMLNSPVTYYYDANGKIVLDTSRLGIFALERLRNGKTHQYDYSNIMFARDGIMGLFDENGVPVEGADKLFQIKLFNGSQNNETGDAATYEEISHRDFIASAFVEYFNPDVNGRLDKATQGNYFVRTQSDAPKTFLITAPKYNTGKVGEATALLSYLNSEDIESRNIALDSLIKDVPVTYKSAKDIKKGGKDISLDQAVVFLTRNNLADIFLGKNPTSNFVTYKENVQNPETGKTETKPISLYKVYYQSSKSKDADNNTFVMYLSGRKVKNKNENWYLTDVSLHHVENFNTIPDELKDAVHNARIRDFIREGEVSFGVNTNHIVFRQFKNAFMQELTDAGQQLYNLLNFNPVDKDSKAVGEKNGKKIYRVTLRTDNGVPSVQDRWSGKNMYKTFDKYHRKGEILVFDDKLGRYVLTGNVFHSDRFVKFDNNNNVVRNYGDELLRATREGDKVTSPVIDYLTPDGNNCLQIYVIEDGNGNYVFDHIDISKEQHDMIDEKIADFINDSVIELQDEVGDALSESQSYLRTFDNYVNFALNYHLMYINMNELLEGDSKFYDDGQDFLKRAKEGQAGGIPYGITNFNERPDEPIHAVSSVLGIRDSSTGGIEENSVLHYIGPKENRRPIFLRNKYKAITITNTKKISNDALALEDTLVRKGIMDRKKAHEYISKFSVKTNDAQSYITFEEWVRRVTAMGEYYRYSDIITKVCNNQDLNAKDIQEFVQVQKNFQYDQQYYEQFNIHSPRQIKNAEFVLIPQLLNYVDEEGNTQRTDLGKLYDFMVENDIDQVNTVETSKAGKCNVLTLWDNEGVAQWDSFNEQFSNKDGGTPVEEFSYNYLYRQQETPQHVDAFNKAGIQVMKKMIDNIPDMDSLPLGTFDENGEIASHIEGKDREIAKLAKVKKEFIDLYSANIKSSFTTFGRMLDIKFNENGSIAVDENGRVELDREVLYSKLKQEAKRLGLNTNEIEYVTIGEDGNPIMPSDVSIFITKFENIVQSLINKRITRQQLPGFHAAQVTGLGISEKWSRNNGEIKTAKEWKGNKLRYHPDGKPYIEVVVPRPKVFEGISDEEIFKIGEDGKNMLERLGIDKFIMYRIPTEGKQSVAVGKIVGFTSKLQGSTIIVPDDWVAQTGSDFDIDSIYAINFNLWKDKNGIHKHSLDTKTDKYSILNRYSRYINNAYREYRQENSSNYSAEKQREINAVIASYNAAKDEHDRAFDKFTEGKTVKFREKLDADTRKLYDSIIKDKNKSLVERAQLIVDTFDDVAQNNTPLRKLVNLNKDYLAALNLIETRKGEVQQVFDKDNLFNSRKEYLEKQADVLNLLSYEQFNELSVIEQNSKENRDAAILEAMLKIASSDLVLEETLSRSNCDDIIEARDDMMSQAEKNRRKARSPYNFFDQARYQEECMNGAILKAFSVSRDTFCSICNKVHANLNKSFNVIYFEEDGFNEKELKKHYDIVKKRTVNGKKAFVVSHNQIGWSKDDLNVLGKYITVYTSETTAYHLDAVKLGGIPNLNTLTFGVYKTFVDCGSDFKTAVGFIMQPAIKRIVDAYDKSRSIFDKDFNNVYVDTAIKAIARKLGLKYNDIPITNYTSIEDVIQAFNNEEYLKKFRKEILSQTGLTDKEIELFNFGKDTTGIYNMPFSYKLLKDRYNNTGVFENDSLNRDLFDLAVILQYHSMSGTAENITNYARVCSPDKFGAKQTIFETQKIFDDIQELISRGKKPTDIPLYVVDKETAGRKDMLESIYPGISKGTENFIFDIVRESSYPTLYNFLKYSSGTSLILGRELFNLHKDFIRKGLYAIADSEHLNVPITEKLYNDFRNYILTEMLYDDKILLSNVDNINQPEDVRKQLREQEITRILGYGQTLNTDFEPINVNEPTDDEKLTYSLFTPAQKVLFCQRHFSVPLIAKMLNVNVYNNRSGSFKELLPQTIRFANDKYNIEIAFDDFNKTYFNDNYYLKQLALDLVKYALIAEGFRIRRNGVSRIITNKVLRATGFDQLLTITTDDAKNQLFGEEIYDKYIRSHSDKVKAYRIQKGSPIQFIEENGKISIIKAGALDDSESAGYRSGIVSDNGYYPRYIRFTDSYRDVLMKAVVNDGVLYYYPLTKLNEYEHTEYSADQINNIQFYDKEAYLYRIENDGIANRERKLFNAEHLYQLKVQPNIEEYFNLSDWQNYEREGVSNGFKAVYDLIVENSKKTIAGVEPALFFFSSTLSGYGKSGKTYVRHNSTQQINGNYYSLIKIHQTNTNLNHFSKDLTGSINWYVKQMKNGKMETFENKNESFVDAIRKIAEADEDTKRMYINSLYVAVNITNKPVTRRSTLRDTSLAEPVGTIISNIYADRNSASGVREEQVLRTTRNLQNAGIYKSEKVTLETNMKKATDITRKYIVDTSKYFTDRIKNFISTETEQFAIDSEEVTARVINNPVKDDVTFRDEFIKFLLDYDNFINQYQIVESMASDDIDVAKNIEKMVQAVRKLKEPEYANKIEKAKRNFFIDFVKTISTDPLIQDEIFDVTDGFNNVSFLESWLSDSLEAGIPLMQVILKDVLGDIEGKTMRGRQEAKDNVAFFANLEKEAIANGRTLDYNHIIDPYGRFWRDYTDKLTEDYGKWRDKLNEIKERNEGTNSVEYLVEDYKFRVWKNNNFNQYYVKGYYDAYLQNDNDIIYGNSSRNMIACPEVLVEYNRLLDEIRELREKIAYDSGTEEDERAVEKKYQQLAVLRGDDTIAGVPIKRKSISEATTLQERVHSAEAAATLKEYLNKKDELNAAFHDPEDLSVFNEILDKCLKTINDKEKSYLGAPVTQDILMKDEEYVRAYRWLRYNAKYVFKDEKLKAKVREAFDSLKKNTPEESRGWYQTLCSRAANGSAYDIYGIPNGNAFSDEQKAIIKEHQEAQTQRTPGTLIKPILNDGVFYTEEFYKGFYGKGTTNSRWTGLVKSINKILEKAYNSRTRRLNLSDLSKDDLYELARLYDKLNNKKLKHYMRSEGASKRIREYIEDNVEFETNYNVYNSQLAAAELRDASEPGYLDAWKAANLLTIINEDGNAEQLPNLFLYSTMKPKGRYKIHRDSEGVITKVTGDADVIKLIDLKKSKAIQTINKYSRDVITHYYWEALDNAMKSGNFDEWFVKNHVYDPYTNRYVPLQCWIRSEYKGYDRESPDGGYEWQPARQRYNRSVKKEYVNTANYKRGKGSFFSNYRKGGDYDNTSAPILNEEEKKAKERMEQIISDYTFGAQKKTLIIILFQQ